MKDFGGFDEWQATCLSAGRGIADEHSVSLRITTLGLVTALSSLQSSRLHRARLPHHQLRRRTGRQVYPPRLRRLHNSRSLPNPLVSAPSTQDQAERYAVCTFRMAVLLT